MRTVTTFAIQLPSKVDVLVYPSMTEDPHPERGCPHYWKVHVVIIAPDVRTGVEGYFGFVDEHRCGELPDLAKQAEWALEGVIRGLRHEVKEQLALVQPSLSPHKERAES